jgi:pimeloyl-[acyl-carrier protein] methyl ester esterase
MILRFLHGWAGGAGVWERLIPLLPEFDCRADDRGYFAEPRPVESGAIVVAHSFGAMRALAAPGGMKALVAINGFDCFTARPGFPATPPRVVERMLARFDQDAQALVAGFRASVGVPETPPIRDAVALHADLAALRDDDRRAGVAVPVISLQAADDPIVPASVHPHLFAGAPAVERIDLAVGGHVLPETAPEACAAAIRRAVELWG